MWLTENVGSPDRHLLTFDVEHWYESYRSRGFSGWEKYGPRDPAVVEAVLQKLETYGAGATFFVTGRFAAEFPGVVQAIARAGHEVASHGYEHVPIQRLGGQEEFRQDVRRSISVLQDLAGKPVEGFRAPNWSLNAANRQWVLETLAEEGLVYDSSSFPRGVGRLGNGRSSLGPHVVAVSSNRSLWEFPPCVLCVASARVPVAGGFYLRLFPEAATRAGLRQAAQAGRPGLVYLHPYDLDPTCPRIRASLAVTLMRSFRLSRAEAVLDRLLRTFQFTSIRDWLARHTPEDG